MRYDQKRNSVATPMPRNLNTLLCSWLSQSKPYVATNSTPFSITRPTQLKTRKSPSSLVRPALSRSR